MSSATPARIAQWLLLIAATAGVTVAGEAIGIPSAAMLAGLLVGLAWSIGTGRQFVIDHRVNAAAQGITGAAIGTYLSADTISGLGDAWVPVVVISLMTLALTFGAGLLLARIADVEPATAAFGMIAGGAAGIVSIANELGADDRMVAVMQYLRVLLILALTPVVAGAAFDHGTTAQAGELMRSVSFGDGMLLLVICVPAGIWLGHAAHFTAPAFFGPLAIAAPLTLAGVSFTGQMPNLIPFIAFGVIGAKVGLEFTAETVRRASAILPQVLAVILLMLLICGLLGVLLAPLAHVSRLDGYLAMAPGVLQVVLATAIGMKANTAFILAAQVVRLLLMLLAAPLVARRLLAPRPERPEAFTDLDQPGPAPAATTRIQP